MFTLSQGLDYLDNPEVSSDTEKESLSDLQSVKIDQAVMLILMIITQRHQIQVILAAYSFLVLLYWK